MLILTFVKIAHFCLMGIYTTSWDKDALSTMAVLDFSFDFFVR